MCQMLCNVNTIRFFRNPALPTPALYGSHHHLLSFPPSSFFFLFFPPSLSSPLHRSFTDSVLASFILSLYLLVVILFGDVQPLTPRPPERNSVAATGLEARQLHFRPILSSAPRPLLIEDLVVIPLLTISVRSLPLCVSAR